MPVHKKLNCKKNDCISDYEKNTLKIKWTYFGIIMQTKFTSAGKNLSHIN